MKWQPIETAPKDGSFILTRDDTWNGWPYLVVRWNADDGWWEDVEGCPNQFTHWAPIRNGLDE